MTDYFADISSYQRSDLQFFQNFVSHGVGSVFIKTTQGSADGSNYLNPKARTQAKNALAAGMNVGFYHYFKASSVADAINEAKFFEQSVVNLGFEKDTPLCVDVEDPSLNTSAVASYVDAFINYLKTQSYTNVFQYSMASWFNEGILNANKYPTWVANYGSSDCGTRGNIVAWQYTSSWGGGSQDMSYDWGIFDKQPVKTEATTQPKVEPEKPKVENVIKLTEQTQPVDRLGIERPETYEASSTWKSSDIVMINNEPHYQIATDIFVPISKTTFKDFIIVKYTDDSPAPVFDSKGNRAQNASVSTGKAFKTDGVRIINGIPMAKIATDQFIPFEYTSGSRF
ncbi:GH25 family lysozyme [Companilactobacillus kedongensis]|uniref:GH25 family lysozyme n=1 Tax=Companilactobacillus kedongensis TaxID=2486004 RepID=UPI0013DDFA15|nr:GH25 family lysozyme [Companilactobacillus kedongensis]